MLIKSGGPAECQLQLEHSPSLVLCLKSILVTFWGCMLMLKKLYWSESGAHETHKERWYDVHGAPGPPAATTALPHYDAVWVGEGRGARLKTMITLPLWVCTERALPHIFMTSNFKVSCEIAKQWGGQGEKKNGSKKITTRQKGHCLHQHKNRANRLYLTAPDLNWHLYQIRVIHNEKLQSRRLHPSGLAISKRR